MLVAQHASEDVEHPLQERAGAGALCPNSERLLRTSSRLWCRDECAALEVPHPKVLRAANRLPPNNPADRLQKVGA